jgi:F-type H+-transporting ATPase subunit epsilon
MHLKVLLPSQLLVEAQGVTRVVAETQGGSFGLLPHRLDCVAALVPGILIYQRQGEPEVYLAVDEGVLIKTGADVLVSVRRASIGTELRELRGLVEQEFRIEDEQQQQLRSIMTKLESGLLRRLADLDHE